MTPMQQILLGVGAKKKAYLDDVFSNYLYRGDGSSTKTITNGIDLAGEGGLTWIKHRDATQDHVLVDTVRGATKKLHTNKDNGQATDSSSLKAFNSTGFLVGSHNEVNQSSNDFVSWSFRKSKGFFDCVTYTGNGSNRTISHDLGSVPGFYIIKRIDSTSNSDWVCFHKDFWGPDYYAVVNSTAAMVSDAGMSNNTWPTSSTFSVGTDSRVNVNGGTFICYLFAGGPSPAATANCVGFNNSQYLYPAASTDFAFGTGDFTIECWVQSGSVTSNKGVFQLSATSGGITTGSRLTLSHTGTSDSNKWELYLGTGSNQISTVETPDTYQWYHVAVVRSSGVIKLYVNGTERISSADTTDYTFQNLAIGGYYSSSYLWDGKISNFRVVKGTAVYTSSFRPPTEPLTNITNTKLLCCQSSTSATAAAVSPTTITNSGSASARSESPFDDPAAYIFGEEGNQSIIKCGTFSTTSSSANRDVELGWEPQWVITKKVDGTSNWEIWDTMRGWTPPGLNDNKLEANDDDADYGSSDYGGPHSTGFHNNGVMGYSGEGVYIAIRRLDGYVSKPADAGTSVFAIDTGNGSSTIPAFDSGFPVDFAFQRPPADVDSWVTGARLIGTKYLSLNLNNAESTDSEHVWDSNTGWKINAANTRQSWMWKRHAGFDVVTTKGGAYKKVAHSLGKAPEMYWVKNGSNAADWMVYHKGLNGGSNPENYYVMTNSLAAQSSSSSQTWGSFAPTSTHISFGNSDAVGSNSSYDYVVMLFASVDKISKVGFYNGSSSDQTISTGFAPRFLILKKLSAANSWFVADTTRGWASSDTKLLQLQDSAAQFSNADFGAPTSTGFTLDGSESGWNDNNATYIYYAHA